LTSTAVLTRVWRLSLYASSIRSTTAGRRGLVGKTAVRKIDGENAKQKLSNENGQRNYPKCPKRQKSLKNRGFCGSEFG